MHRSIGCLLTHYKCPVIIFRVSPICAPLSSVPYTVRLLLVSTSQFSDMPGDGVISIYGDTVTKAWISDTSLTALLFYIIVEFCVSN